MLTFIRTDAANNDFIDLVAKLDLDLAIRDGEDHFFYAQFNKTDSIRNVIICYMNDKPAGTGGFKQYETGKAEIKRMYVLPEFRKQGIAFKILQHLEIWAAEDGFTECILETGKKQPEAIALYHKAGYSDIPNYGQYQNVQNSVCMSKRIG